MAYKSYPYVDQATTTLEYSVLMQRLSRNGVEGAPTATDLAGSAPSSGMTTRIALGVGLVNGFIFDNNSAGAVIPITHAAASAQARIDRVVLRVDLSKPVTERIVPAVLTGTPGTTPAVPGLSRDIYGIFEEPLYRVAIATGTTVITPAMITDERRDTGQPIGRWSDNSKPLEPLGLELGYNTTSGRWEFYNGSTYVPLLDWANVVNKPATSTLDGRNILQGDNPPTAGQGVNGDIYLEY